MKKVFLSTLSILALVTSISIPTIAHGQEIVKSNHEFNNLVFHPNQGIKIEHPIYHPNETIEFKHPVYRYENEKVKKEYTESVEMKHVHVKGKVSKDLKSGLYKLNAPLMTYELKGSLTSEMRGLVGAEIEVHGEVPDYRYLMAPSQETMYLTSYTITDTKKTIFLEGRIIKKNAQNSLYQFETKKNTYPLLGHLNYEKFENKVVVATGRITKSNEQDKLSFKAESLQLSNHKRFAATGILEQKEKKYILKADSGKEYTLEFKKTDKMIEKQVGEELSVEGVLVNMIQNILKVHTYSILGTYSFPKFKAGHLI